MPPSPKHRHAARPTGPFATPQAPQHHDAGDHPHRGGARHYPTPKANGQTRAAGKVFEGMYDGPAKPPERAADPNAERAGRASAGLKGMIAGNPQAAARLTPAIVDMLVKGVANRRSSSERGQEGILGVKQVKDAAAALLALQPSDYEKVAALLSRAGQGKDGKPATGADAGAEQALILEALGARKGELGKSSWDRAASFVGIETHADETLDLIGRFAGEIRGTERGELIRSTTAIDLDDRNTSSVDPDHLLGPADTRGDNDGLTQRYTTSCAVTVAQQIRAESDPIYALELHRDPAEAGREQREVLEAHGGHAVERLRQQTVDKLGGIDQANLDARQLSVVRDLVADDRVSDERLASVHLPLSEAELASLRGGPGKEAAMYADFALADVAAQATGKRYEHHSVGARPDVAGLEARLADGEDLLFATSPENGPMGHALMMSDVRHERDGKRRFLVSDPWSGATRWVSEADLASGAFNTKDFDLGKAKVSDVYTESGDK